MCRRKIGNLFAACLGTAVLSAVAMTASAQVKNPVNKTGDGVTSAAAMMDFKDGADRWAFPQDLPHSVINRGSPPLGGGCQTASNANGINYGPLFHCADNFNVAATGQLTGVSWSAAYRAGTTTLSNGTPPTSESFIIRILNDNAGVPGSQVFTTTVSNTNGVGTATRTNSGSTLGTPALTIWDYSATIASGPTLDANTCYWLEITNTSVLPGGTATNVSFWVTANPVPGDTVGYQDDTPDSISNCGGYDAADQVVVDLTFCLNLALNNLDGANCPIATLPAVCTNSSTNGTGISSASNTGFNSASPGSIFPATITGVFQRAENFSVTSAGNLQSVCFWGFFAGTGLTVNSCARNFDVIVWNNANATGQPDTVRGQVTVGTTAGVTLSRSIDNVGNEVFTVNLGTANQIALSANTCYHLGVSNNFNTNVAAQSARFIWGTTPAASVLGGPIDNKFWSRAITSGSATPGVWQVTSSTTDNRFNLNYLLNVGPAGAPVCVPPPPANDTCATATTLTPGVPVAGSNVNATHEDLPGTAFDLVDGASVWYTFVGSGNNTTVSTCNAATILDTVVHVFCAPNGCAGPFNRVAGNDDDATPCAVSAGASNVTFATISGTTYYVVVTGFQGNQNVFTVTMTTGAASGATTCTPNCDLTADAFDVAETDACGAGTGLDNNNTCATASVYPTLGQTAKGSVSTTAGAGGTRDIDLWRMPASANGATVAVHMNAENPVLVQFLNDASGTCATAFTVVANSTFGLAPCLGIGAEIFEVTLPATGTNYFLITAPSFGGSACTLGLDEYRFQVAIPAVGACCLASTACFVTTFADCDAQSAGDPADFWAEGVTCGVNPCDSQPGKCCLQDGSCQLVPSVTIGNAAACTTAGGTYTAAGVCTPNTCPVASNVACCRGSSCVLEPAAGCTGPNTFNSGAGACNAAGNFTSPCCKADFNHVGGITVQDIFDFLSAYFTANPGADINGVGGVTVQDIFDFLGGYFAGGCP